MRLNKRHFMTIAGAGLLGAGPNIAEAKPNPDRRSLIAAQNAANARPGSRVVPGRAIPPPEASVSAAARAAIARPYNPLVNFQPADSLAWRDLVNSTSSAVGPGLEQQRQALGVSMKQTVLDGVPCYVLEPAAIPTARRDHMVVVLHGGGYVFGSGVSGTTEAMLVAATGGYRVISVDYRMPPDSPFPAAIDDVIAVWREILKDHDPSRVAMAGTSAGGGLILAVMHRAKQLGLPLPGAIAPSSPWSDLTETGDSYRTNEWLDNVLVTYSGFLGRAARLYANGHDMRDPLLSPINGDFTGFPPSILTAGTRDLFLSNTVRVHREMRRAAATSELHVYEGLSHAQFNLDPEMPETREIYLEIAGFFDRFLRRS